MAFECELMSDPVFASDGFTYERRDIEKWMKEHGTSPLTSQPLEHKMLMPNMMARQLIAAWCEQNGLPARCFPQAVPQQVAVAGGGAAEVPLAVLLQKPVVTCELHPKEQLRVFCKKCGRAVCCLCAADTDICKSHTTKVLDPLIEELKTDRENWELAQRECDESALLLCTNIQADGDAKKRVYIQEIDKQVATLLQQVRSAAAARSAAFGAIVQKRQEREDLVAAAAASPQVAVRGSAAAAAVASAFDRAKAPIPSASAAQFRPVAAAAAAVGQLVMASEVGDPEDAAVRAVASMSDAPIVSHYFHAPPGGLQPSPGHYAPPGAHIAPSGNQYAPPWGASPWGAPPVAQHAPHGGARPLPPGWIEERRPDGTTIYRLPAQQREQFLRPT
jgi:hypothetical protein